MKKLCAFIILCSSLCYARHASGQNSTPASTVVKDWTGLVETQTECEIYYSLVKCGDERKVFLKFYNEVPFAQNIKIKVTVKYSGYIIKQDINVSVSPNQTIAGDCNSTNGNLLIKLLPLWDLDKTSITAELTEAKTSSPLQN
jgi:hypothetical protein